MRKILLILLTISIIAAISYKLYINALYQSDYVGLPTVPCQDYTLPIKQNYSLTIKININNKNYPLSSTIGHDFGKCLHAIFTNDNSGKIYVKANDTNMYTLGQFFDTWHKTFSKTQVFNYQSTDIKVWVNGKQVNTYRTTLLKPNEVIEVTYK